MTDLSRSQANMLPISLEHMLDMLPDGVALLDEQGHICYHNLTWKYYDPKTIGIDTYGMGTSYLAAFADRFISSGLDLETIANQIEAVQSGVCTAFQFEYLDSLEGCIHCIRVTLLPYTHTLTRGVLVCLRDMVHQQTSDMTLHSQQTQLDQHLVSRLQQQRRLLEIGKSMVGMLDIEAMLQHILVALRDVICYDSCLLYFLDQEAQVFRLHFKLDAQQPGLYPEGWFVPVGQGIVSVVADTTHGLLLNHAEQDTRSVYPPVQDAHCEHLIGIPLRAHERLIGVFFLIRVTDPLFSIVDFELVQTFTDYTSLAIENARLYAAARNREQQYRMVVDNIREIIFQTDCDGRWTFLNPAWKQITGLPIEPNLGTLLLDTIHPQDRGNAAASLKRMLAGSDTAWHAELRLLLGGTTICWVELSAWTLFDVAQQVMGLTGTLHDITDRKRAEAALRDHQHRFQTLLEHVNDIILVVTTDGDISYVSPSIRQRLGYTPDDVRGSSLYTYVHPGEQVSVRCALTDVLRATDGVQQLGELRLHHAQGDWAFFEVIATSLIHDPTVQGVVLNAHDITERKGAEGRLQELALHDTLTGLPNRAYLMERLQHVMDMPQHDRPYLCAMLFIDLDNFKLVNDSLGHYVGDLLLQDITQRLRSCVRSHDTLARLGGDEFVILLEGIEQPQDATDVAERIQRMLIEPFLLDGHEVFATASIGIALNTQSYTQPQDLLRDADTAMYYAKDNGKAQYTVFDTQMHARVMERLTIQGDLQRAVERDELRLYYQPIFDLRTNRLIGLEALMRWLHPRLGLLEPVEFIEVAEETGAIIALGHWALLEACQQVHHWQDKFPQAQPFYVSVNLSSKQFWRADLVDRIGGILHETQLGAASLKLEMKESVALQKARASADILTVLNGLHDNGIQLWVDDFGSGYASLSYLHAFRIDTLKIDRSFITSLGQEARSTEIVRTIISLAHNLGMQVIAEGIEQPEQVDHLRDLGCVYGQGYLLAQPLIPQEVEYLLAQQT